jgi:hypothetical protein
MPCYIISYDLPKEADAKPLQEAIKKYGTWAHITDTTWAVVTEQKSTEIREKLTPYLPQGSRLFVVKSGTAAAWRNVIARNEWLKKYL